MKITFTLLILSLSINTFGQTLKTFNGTYMDGRVPNGTAIYTYFEDATTREYIKQGMFKYSNNTTGFVQTISGNFVQGLKNGVWSYLITLTDLGTQNPYYTGTVTLIANYKNGYANGTWKFNKSFKNRSKYYSSGQYKWKPYEPIKNKTIIMNFKEGELVGSVNINDEFANFKAVGSYDNNGLSIGKWMINDLGWGGNNKELTYKDNFLYESITRKNNGEVFASSKTYIDEYDNFIKAKGLSIKEREESGVSIDTICGSDLCEATKGIKEYFSHFLNDDYFLYKYIGGDLSYKGGFKGGCELNLKINNYAELNNIQDYKTAEKYYTDKNYLQAYDLYYRIDLENVKPSERIKVSSRIIEIEPMLESLKKAKDEKKIADEKTAEIKKAATEKAAIEKIAEIKKVAEYLITQTKSLTAKKNELYTIISEQKNKLLSEPKNYIKFEAFEEYSTIFKDNVTYFRGQIVKKGYFNIYNAYKILIDNCTKSNNPLTAIELITKQIEITNKFILICTSENYKKTDKQLEDIIDINAIKKMIILD